MALDEATAVTSEPAACGRSVACMQAYKTLTSASAALGYRSARARTTDGVTTLTNAKKPAKHSVVALDGRFSGDSAA